MDKSILEMPLITTVDQGDILPIVDISEPNDELRNKKLSVNQLIGSKADIDSPFFIGSPQANTPAASDNTTKLATTAFVKRALSNIGTGDYTSPINVYEVAKGNREYTDINQAYLDSKTNENSLIVVHPGEYQVVPLEIETIVNFYLHPGAIICTESSSPLFKPVFRLTEEGYYNVGRFSIYGKGELINRGSGEVLYIDINEYSYNIEALRMESIGGNTIVIKAGVVNIDCDYIRGYDYFQQPS